MKKKSNTIKAVGALAVLMTMIIAGIPVLADDQMNPFDPIFYDTNPALFLPSYNQPGTKFAVRFTPDQSCTLHYAQIVGAIGNGDVLIHVWSDNNGYPSEDLITPFTYNLIGNGEYRLVTFTSPVNVGAQDFHVGWELMNTAPPYATTDGDGNTESRSKAQMPQGSWTILDNDLNIRVAVQYMDNEPPTVPIITGPSTGDVGVDYNFTISAADPDGDNLTYNVSWDDGTTNNYGPFPSGQSFDASHTWTDSQTYDILVIVKDMYGANNESTHTIEIMNNAPGAPVITGPTTGEVGVEYTFSIVSTDPEGNDITYHVTWGDGTSDNYGPKPSGQAFDAKHTWTSANNYTITAIATDAYGAESAPGTHSIVITSAVPTLEITLKTGFGLGVNATIANTGEADATNVEWTMTVTGGILGLINVSATGTEANLQAGDSIIVDSGLLIGLGAIEITISVTCHEGASDEVVGKGFQFIIFTIVSE